MYQCSSAALLSYTLIISITSLGLAIGCLLSTYSDKFGRLPVLIITAITSTLCYLGQYLAGEFDLPWLLIICRGIVGVVGGVYETTNIVYIIEIVPDSWKFFAESSFTFGNIVGFILGLISTLDVTFGTADLWYYAFFTGLLMSLIALISFVLCDIESIEQVALVSKEKAEILSKELYPNDEKRIKLILEISKRNEDTRSVIEIAKDLYKDTGAWRAFIVMTASRCQIIASGVDVIYSYFGQVMTNAGIGEAPRQYILMGLFVFLGVVQFPIAGFVERYRTKPFVMAGEFMMGLSLIAFGVFFAEDSSPSMYIAGVVFMFIDQVGYCTWEPIAFRMGNDFMPTEYRAFSVMAAAVCSEILTFIGSLAFPYGDKALGSNYFYILGAIGNLRNDQMHSPLSRKV